MRWLDKQNLKSENPKTRLKALENIAKAIEPGDVELLRATLADPEREIRLLAAKTLGLLKDPEAADPIVKLLENPDAEIIQTVAVALKNIGDKSTGASLAPFLTDPQEAVRVAVAATLEALRWTPPDDERRAWFYVARGRMNAAGELGIVAVEPLIAALHSCALHRRPEVVEALGKTADSRVVKPLIHALKEADPVLRAKLFDVLSRLNDPRCIEPLLHSLRDDNAQARAAGVEGLIRIADVRVITSLAGMLHDESPKVRQAVIEVLGKTKDARAIQPLIEALQDSEAAIRQIAIESLGQARDPRAIAPIVLCFKDPNEAVRHAVEPALKAIDPAWDHTPDAQRAARGLKPALNNDDFQVRQTVTTVLRRIVGEATTEPAGTNEAAADFATPTVRAAVGLLRPCLGDPDRDVRLAAAQALGRLGHKSAIAPLVETLHDPDEWVRVSAARALTALDWIPANDHQTALQMVILREWDKIAALGSPALDALKAALASPDTDVRAAAATTLGRIPDPRSAPWLAEALGDNMQRVRQAAAQALSLFPTLGLSPTQQAAVAVELGQWEKAAAFGKASVPFLLRALKECPEQAEVRSLVGAALCRIIDVSAVDPLLQATADPETTDIAVASLEKIVELKARQMLADYLWKISALKDVLQNEYKEDPGLKLLRKAGTRPVDTSRLQALALQELTRRGLTS